MSYMRRLLVIWRKDPPMVFEKENVLYAIYPFYQLCKFCALCPLSVRNSNGKTHFDLSIKMFFYSLGLLFVYVVGFIAGAKMLHEQPVRAPTIISHFSGWAQIYSLFFIAALDVVWSWATLPKLVELVERIQHIDKSITSKLATTTSYNRHLRILYLQVVGLSIVPFCLSMVNCIILNERNFKLNACFWFICFAPILVITLKEFQFYNFMLLLKSKFTILNKELDVSGRKRFVKLESATSIESDKECLTRLENSEERLRAKLKDIARISDEITTATKAVLELFSLHLFLVTSTALGVITVQIYNFYAFLIDYLYLDIFSIFATVTWICLQFAVVLLNVAVCSMVANEMANTGPLLHNIQSLSDNRSVFQTDFIFRPRCSPYKFYIAISVSRLQDSSTWTTNL
ncbi:uncharacterized protein LOC119661569 isoform X2 [Hermetia illucens]|uniref:uncharacterized protein LOC119661569 isoform X2 n=1 Tax=Hermetia illucens TaxID=343691 RepID=UPI0018CC0626|nr:uncharacterized protein LOC119661569 isoform X2 [Hermetia illucens]